MSTARTRGAQRGSALIIVLWTSIFISAALAVAIASARIEARIEASRMDAFHQKLALRNGLEAAALLVAERNQSAEEALFNFKYESNGYAVHFEPSIEAGKLDLNVAAESQLAAFFEFLGVEKADAATFAARVADWRDPDNLVRANGAERLDYASARNGERIGNRPFYSIDELKLVLGMPESVVTCALPVITVLAGRGALSNQLLRNVYGRELTEDNSVKPTVLGTNSGVARAGVKHSVTAYTSIVGDRTNSISSVTGVFRITGEKANPIEWLAIINKVGNIPSDPRC